MSFPKIALDWPWTQSLTLIVASVLICSLTFVSLNLLKKYSAAIRHRVIVAAICGHLLLAAGAFILPRVNLAILPAVTEIKQQETATRSPNDPSLTTTPSIQSDVENNFSKQASFDAGLATSQYSPEFHLEKPIEDEPIALSHSRFSQGAASSSTITSQPFNWPRFTGLVWISGVAVVWGRWLLARTLIHFQIVNLQSLIRLPKFSEELSKTCQLMGLKHQPQVRIWTENRIPLQVGFWRPIIVVSKDFFKWPRSKQQHVLLHELAHIARHDSLWDSMSWMVTGIYWFNPLLWMLKRRQETEREFASDHLVVTLTKKPEDYATDLVTVVRDATKFANAAATPMARSSELTARVGMIIQFNSGIRKSSWLAPAICCVTILVTAATSSSIALSRAASSELVNNTGNSAVISVATDQSTDGDSTETAELERQKLIDRRDAYLDQRYGPPKVHVLNVDGQVLDSTGIAVANATVYLREDVPVRNREETGNLSILSSEQQSKVLNYSFAETVTDSNGKFLFEDIESPPIRRPYQKDQPNTWSVFIVPAADSEVGRYWHKFENTPEARNLTIELPPKSTLNSKVVDNDGKPVSGAVIHVDSFPAIEATELSELYRSAYFMGPGKLSPRAVSAEDGTFSIPELPQGYKCHLIIRHPDYVWNEHYHFPSVALDSNQVDAAPFTLDRGWKIKCIFQDEETGKPVPNVPFRMSVGFRNGDRILDSRFQNLQSDDNGEMLTPPLPAYEVEIFPMLQNSPFLSRGATFQPPEDPQIIEHRFVLSKGKLIHGQLIDEEGNPIADDGIAGNLAVTMIDTSNDRGDRWAGKVKPDGSFEIRTPNNLEGQIAIVRKNTMSRFDLPTSSENGLFWVGIKKFLDDEKLNNLQQRRSYRNRSPLMEMPSRRLVSGSEKYESDSPLRLVVKRSVSVRGKVVDQHGQRVPNAKFELLNRSERLGNPESQPDFETNMAGEFELTGIQRRLPPIWKISHPESDNFIIYAWSPDKTSEDKILKFESPDKTMLNVLVTLDGEPLANQEVKLNASFFNVNRIIPGIMSVKTDKNGRAKFRSIADAKSLTVISQIGSKDGDKLELQRNRNMPEDSFRDLEMKFFTLDGIVSGQVVTPDGKPVADARINFSTVRPKDGSMKSRNFKSVTTDSSGKFITNQIPDGTPLRIRVSPKAHKNERYPRSPTAAIVDAKGGDTDLRIILDPRASHELPWR